MRLGPSCLVVQNGSITDTVRDALVRASQKLMREHSRRCRIKGPTFEGAVTTAHRSACLGGFAGTVFDATVDEGERTINVRYLCPRVRDDLDLDDLVTEVREECDLTLQAILEVLNGVPDEQ